MKITDLDFYATYGDSFLHRTPARYKLTAVALVATVCIYSFNTVLLGCVYGVLATTILCLKTNRKRIFAASLYPFIFLIFFFLSINNLTPAFLITLILKVLCISTAFSMLIFTTNYKDIFLELGKFLPPVINRTLFFTYRSLFILAKTMDNLKTSTDLRGGFNIRKPLYSLSFMGNMIGLFIINSIETNEKMYESMTIRGF